MIYCVKRFGLHRKEVRFMFVKDLSLSFLLDFYGDVLPERQRKLLSCYYNDDLSLAEIAETESLSRQGVRHILKKGEEELRFLEEKLGLAARYLAMKRDAEALRSLADEVLDIDIPKVARLSSVAKAVAERIINEA